MDESEQVWEKLQKATASFTFEPLATAPLRGTLTCAKCRLREFEPKPVRGVIPIWCPHCTDAQ